MVTPNAALFPYATLFRSVDAGPHGRGAGHTRGLGRGGGLGGRGRGGRRRRYRGRRGGGHTGRMRRWAGGHDGRSEEQTSELQLQFHLVCRFLLEKKKARK